MLSKNMYSVLSCFPRNTKEYIMYEDLIKKCNLSKEDIDACLDTTIFPEWHYIYRTDVGFKNGGKLYLTETAIAEVEVYEQTVEERKIVKDSLTVARVAMWVSIFSAIVAIASLITMFI